MQDRLLQKARCECPVKDFIDELPPQLRAKNMRELMMLSEFGTELPQPYAKRLHGSDAAERVGTSQANISKLEHGTLNPSFEMARRVAAGLGKRLCVSMQ